MNVLTLYVSVDQPRCEDVPPKTGFAGLTCVSAPSLKKTRSLLFG
jgi:hypothetical protein